MKKTTLYLTAQQHERTKSLAVRENRSQADVIRAAIEAYVSSSRPAPAAIGIGASGGGSVAASKRDWMKEFGEHAGRRRRVRPVRDS